MRKIYGILCILAVVFSLSGCGVSTTESISGGSKDEGNSKNNDITVEEQEIYNSNDIIVKVTGIEMDGFYGPELKLYIENNSDKDITVQSDYASMNGWMMEPTMSCDVVAGSKANTTLDWFSSEMDKSEITTVGQMEFKLNIIDGDYNTIAESEMITVKTSADGTFEQTYDMDGTEIYNKDGVVVKVTGYVKDSIWGDGLAIEVSNTSGKTIIVQPESCQVNGYTIDSYYSETVLDGKYSIGELNFSDAGLDDNVIESIDEIKINVNIIDEATFETIDTGDVYTITP